MFEIQSIFNSCCLTGLKIIPCDSVDLLFWNCHYFLEQPFCAAASRPWVLLLHITVILLCKGRICLAGLESVSADLMPQYTMFKSGRNPRIFSIFCFLLPCQHGTLTLLGNRMLYMCVYLSFFLISLIPVVLQL